MSKSKKIKNAVRLSIVMSKEQADRVKLMAIRMSSQEQRQITVSEALRMAVESTYPVPKNQLDLF